MRNPEIRKSENLKSENQTLMVTPETFKQMALSFEGAQQYDHFGRPAFKSRITFATLWEKDNKAMVKLPLPDQYVFTQMDNAVFYPVPGGWGRMGCTFVELGKVKKSVLKEALTIAYTAATVKKKKM
ncbi:MAG: hypothetical protein JWN76_1559 [Chitinophagaceae bacterium]|nr:hypothetical protein [Chitinophagaceae bacterium]